MWMICSVMTLLLPVSVRCWGGDVRCHSEHHRGVFRCTPPSKRRSIPIGQGTKTSLSHGSLQHSVVYMTWFFFLFFFHFAFRVPYIYACFYKVSFTMSNVSLKVFSTYTTCSCSLVCVIYLLLYICHVIQDYICKYDTFQSSCFFHFPWP